MTTRARWLASFGAALCGTWLIMGGAAWGQTPGGRQLAPGVIKTIPATPLEEETMSGPRPLAALVPKLPEWTPNYSPRTETLATMVRETTFHRSVWQLEFNFKPVRMIEVSLPDGRGGTRTEIVWYLLYQLRNTGSHLRPVPEQDESGHTTYKVQRVDHAVRTFPTFVLHSHDHDRQYVDEVIPAAIDAIHARELRDPRVTLYSSAGVSAVPLEVSTSELDRGIWAVATWRGVDPRTDFLSVFVRGLSNAHRWEDRENAAELPAGEAAELTYKTLQLAFWRPGDTVREAEDAIRFGMPDNVPPEQAERVQTMYGMEGPQAYRWLYLP